MHTAPSEYISLTLYGCVAKNFKLIKMKCILKSLKVKQVEDVRLSHHKICLCRSCIYNNDELKLFCNTTEGRCAGINPPCVASYAIRSTPERSILVAIVSPEHIIGSQPCGRLVTIMAAIRPPSRTSGKRWLRFQPSSRKNNLISCRASLRRTSNMPAATIRLTFTRLACPG